MEDLMIETKYVYYKPTKIQKYCPLINALINSLILLSIITQLYLIFYYVKYVKDDFKDMSNDVSSASSSMKSVSENIYVFCEKFFGPVVANFTCSI